MQEDITLELHRLAEQARMLQAEEQHGCMIALDDEENRGSRPNPVGTLDLIEASTCIALDASGQVNWLKSDEA